MRTYSLTIRRYGRHITFNSLEELVAEVKQYFTKSESGIVDRLTTFGKLTKVDDEYSYAERDYRDMKVVCHEWND